MSARIQNRLDTRAAIFDAAVSLVEAKGLRQEEIDLPSSLTAYLIVTHLAGAAAWWLNRPDDDLRELLDTSLDQCLHGLAAQTTASARTAPTAPVVAQPPR